MPMVTKGLGARFDVEEHAERLQPRRADAAERVEHAIVELRLGRGEVSLSHVRHIARPHAKPVLGLDLPPLAVLRVEVRKLGRVPADQVSKCKQ